MPVVTNAVHAEIIPLTVRNEGFHFEHVVGPRPQPDQTRNHEVGEAGMVVIGAARFVDDPVARERVQVLGDPGLAVLVLRAAYIRRKRQVVFFGGDMLLVVVQQVGQGDQCLGRGIRPGWTIPQAVVVVLLHESRGSASAVVGPNGAAKPLESVSCLQADSKPGSGRLKYQGTNPTSSRTSANFLPSPRGSVLKN